MTDPMFNVRAPDWRAALDKNRRKTRFVIACFICLYLIVGLVVDLYAHSYIALGARIDIWVKLQELITFQVTPYATLIMGGIAAVALFVTMSAHNRVMMQGLKYREITASTANTLAEQQLYNIVRELKIASSMTYIPRVYIIQADYMNAFASGWSEKSAMVAITEGLLKKLTRAELQAVMAHELSHIRHLDIKLTLTVGVLTNIMLLVIDLLFRHMLYGDSRRKDARLVMVIAILRIVLPLITMLLLLFLSRSREYMADAGAVQLTRNNKPLADALLKIHHDHNDNRSVQELSYNRPGHNMRVASYIYDPRTCGIHPKFEIRSLFSTHPSLWSRLAELGITRKS